MGWTCVREILGKMAEKLIYFWYPKRSFENKYNINSNKMTVTGDVLFEAEVPNTESPAEPMRGSWPDREGWSVGNNSQPKDSRLWSLTPLWDGPMPLSPWFVIQTEICWNILEVYVKDFLIALKHELMCCPACSIFLQGGRRSRALWTGMFTQFIMGFYCVSVCWNSTEATKINKVKAFFFFFFQRDKSGSPLWLRFSCLWELSRGITTGLRYFDRAGWSQPHSPFLTRQLVQVASVHWY